ncbi:hypothetical protein K449DRAFT_441003 [Hypoxylon sp. EC38]|nr:hypothetical protein K449DRAFT_441003 [Hypoxylon sp. EC38]
MVGLDRAVICPAFKWRAQRIGQSMPVLTSQTTSIKSLGTFCLFAGRLEKALDAAFSTSDDSISKIAPHHREPTANQPPGFRGEVGTVAAGLQSADLLPQHLKDAKAALRQLVAEYIMIDESQIPDDTSLELLGLDSLGSAELAEELASRFGLAFDTIGLLECTLISNSCWVSIIWNLPPPDLPPKMPRAIAQ